MGDAAGLFGALDIGTCLHAKFSFVALRFFTCNPEILLEASCPFPDYGCTVLNLARAERHFNLFNISDFIVISDEAKAQIRKLNNFRLNIHGSLPM